MAWSARVTRALVVGIVLASIGATTAAADVGTRGKPKIKSGNACSMLSKAQVDRSFGKPVALNSHLSAPTFCEFDVGVNSSQPPGGTLTTGQLYPTFGGVYRNARDAFDDEHAVDGVAGDELDDVHGVGVVAFIDHTSGKLVVEANKKYVFSLTWSPAPPGTRITNKDLRKLISLAKDVVKRAPH